jgi:elongation factor Ts
MTSGEHTEIPRPLAMLYRQTLLLVVASLCAAAGYSTVGGAPHRFALGAPRTSAVVAQVSAGDVKKLREATGAGMMKCKEALAEANGDFEKAVEELRKKGLASAEKKASRKALEGIVETYIHTGAKLGVMVEVNCETDFVAKNPTLSELARTIAMQVAACPTVEVVSMDDISPDYIEKEKKIESQAEDLKGKPAAIVDKIVTGRVEKLVKTKLLLDQPYIRDPSITVKDLISQYITKMGENIRVSRFVRFNVGEGQTKSEEEE